MGTTTDRTEAGAVRSADVAAIVMRTESALRRLAGRSVVISGAAGFLPSYLVDVLARANDVLLEDPCQVWCLDSFTTGTRARLAHLDGRDDVRLLHHDLREPVALDGQMDVIVHGASIASPTWYRRYPLETIDVNVAGTRHLLDLAVARSAGVFLYLSSSEIYGDPPPDRIPTPEDYWGHVSCTGPRACYDESKRLAETLCMTYHRLHGLPVRLVRPFNVYGPGLRLDDGRIVPDLLKAALAREPLTLYSDGRATRSFCYIADIVAALPYLMEPGLPSGPYNVGNDEEVSIAACAQMVGDLTGLPVRYAESRDVDYLTDNPQRRCPDLSRIKATIPWSPEIGLREGLERTLSSYQEEGR